jgi:hypothetical protein
MVRIGSDACSGVLALPSGIFSPGRAAGDGFWLQIVPSRILLGFFDFQIVPERMKSSHKSSQGR